MSKIFIFLTIVLISFMFVASISFGKGDRAVRGSPSIKEGTQGSIYDINKFLDKRTAEDNYNKHSKNQNQIKANQINIKNIRGAESFVKNYLGIDGNLEIIGQERSEKSNLEFFYYQQTYNNLPVYDSYFDVVTKNGKIVKIEYNLKDVSGISADSSISEDGAIGLVLKDIREDGSEYAKSSVSRIDYEKGDSISAAEMISENKVVWRVIVPNFVYAVDASTGEIISKESTVRDDVYGTVYGRYYPQDPTQNHMNATFENDYVFLSNGTSKINTTSNKTGFYNLSLDGSPFILTSYLWGPYVNVDNLAQNYSVRNISIVSGDNSWNWSDNDSSDRQEESNVFYHVNIIHDYFQKGGIFNLTQIDYSIPAYVEYDACNAYYSGSQGIGELDFGNGGGVSGCENLALGSDIIYHEYTHMVSDGIYGLTDFPYSMQTGAMNEAWSDYYACSINNDPAQGDKILPSGSVRYLNNSFRYPDDWAWEVHNDSRMISGAMWQVRIALGNETADALILDSMKMKPQSFTDVLNDILVADDDNGNLDDGTPNSAEICSAFESHGIVSDYCYEYQGVDDSEYANNTVIYIPDNGSYVSSEIVIPDSETKVIQDIEAYVNVSHGRIPDLEIRLVSPNGTSVMLYGGSHCGWSSGTTLTKWYDQEYPSDGEDCYSPAEMELFNGMKTNGTWYLNVKDYVNTGGKTGQINGFGLKFYYNLSVNVSQGMNPVDHYNDIDGNVTFDFRCASNNNLSLIQLWTNTTEKWQANYSNSSYLNNTWLNITLSGIPDGDYTWGAYCRDSFGNSAITMNRTFTVDAKTPPVISLNSPAEYSNSTSIGFNCSAADPGGLANITLWINSTGAWLENETSNVSGTLGSSVFNKSLNPQTYIWGCSACDMQSNCGFSNNQTLVIDNSAPNLSLYEPEEGHIFAAGTTSIVFKWNVSEDYDSGIDCNVFTNSNYQTLKTCDSGATCKQEISGFSAGSYTWSVNCSDGANQVASESRFFSITQESRGGGGGGGSEVLPPVVNVTNQTNGSEETSGTSGSSQVIKTLGNIVNPTGVAGMPISGLGVGDEISFKIIDAEHTIKIIEINDDSIVVEIVPEPNRISLNSGESKEFDLDGDGRNDFRLTLSRIFNGKATLILFSLPSESAGAIKKNQERNSGFSWADYIILGIALVAAFIAMTFFKKRKSGKREKKNSMKKWEKERKHEKNRKMVVFRSKSEKNEKK